MADGSGTAIRNPPSGVSAGAAAVLMSLLGLWHLVGLGTAFVSLLRGHSAPVLLFAGIGANAVVATLLLTGAVQVFARRPAGRIVGSLGCLLAVVTYVTLAARGQGGMAVGGELLALAIVVVPGLAALVLVLLPASGRWLRRGAAKPPPPGYRPEPRPGRSRT